MTSIWGCEKWFPLERSARTPHITKLYDTNPSKPLAKFQKQLCTSLQLVLKKDTASIITNDKNKIFVVSAPNWLGMLP
jgi:hypothetical protein